MSDTRELEAYPPHRLWMGCANDDQEHAVWFDPHEGGTEYVRADLYATERAAREKAEREREEARVFAEQYQANMQAIEKLEDRADAAEAEASRLREALERAVTETARKCAEIAKRVRADHNRTITVRSDSPLFLDRDIDAFRAMSSGASQVEAAIRAAFNLEQGK